MRNKKVITKILLILAIIILCLISFIGIYVQKQNRMENVVKEYSQTKDLVGYREVILEVKDAYKVYDKDGNEVGDTTTYTDEQIKSSKYTKADEKINKDEILTDENYDFAQKIIEKRLKDMKVEDYNISIDKSTGKIYISLQENDNTDKVVSNIAESGKLELKDSEDGTVLLNNDHVKDVNVVYQQGTSGGTIVGVNIEFNKEGKNILTDISTNKYATIEEEEENEEQEESVEDQEDADSEEKKEEDSKEEKDENSDSKEDSEKVEQKKVKLYISDEDITETSFDEPKTDGQLQLQMNNATTDISEVNEYAKSASVIAAVLRNGSMPIVYTVEENKYVTTDISNDILLKSIIGIAAIFAILLIVLIFKFKVRGLYAVISFIGFIALYLLILRYANVDISIGSIVAGVLALIINYIYNIKLLSNDSIDEKTEKKNIINLLFKLIPIFGVSIAFCFAKLTILITVGMTLVWGIVVMLIYNAIITKYLVDKAE